MKKLLVIKSIILTLFIISGSRAQIPESTPTSAPTVVETTATPTQHPLLPVGFPVEGLIAY